ncbi:hypothetical protein VOLCADRAFT_120064 [Volvox carteri f. nagariensis]|uniref:EF-hand domain-containing protein n=1 Tax=Volvox carteri f. nagariensis TaxID=3068 RepID=D8UJP6_VOLCA|nr:uncharacterized protein VOLCADRAFT_120064 [Volvox carteri f. nagariensis]EFJ40059.1 hypothetical protein VOLCADRAFT_120064 [Volvox carteri f. nagariensis]|eukprot:XP_002958871.1 hypothetical protein VOLCADRAFT_120064 [Volvox carteri f. nagariensis]
MATPTRQVKRDKPFLRLLTIIASKAHILSLWLIFASILGLLALPLLDRQIRFDEKGLLAGLAHPTVGDTASGPAASDIQRIARAAGGAAGFQRPGAAAALAAELRRAGLTETQLTRPTVITSAGPGGSDGGGGGPCRCTNVHTRVKAPRGDGLESLALVTPVAFSPQRPDPSYDGHNQSADGAQLALTAAAALVLHMAKGQVAGGGGGGGGGGRWLVRDLLWVIPDISCGSYQCLDAWVRQYYEDAAAAASPAAGGGRGVKGGVLRDAVRQELQEAHQGQSQGGKREGASTAAGDMIRAGVIQQAVILEALAGASYDTPELLVVGHDGLLPKLDMFYLLRYLFHYPAGPALWRDDRLEGPYERLAGWLEGVMPTGVVAPQVLRNYLRRLLGALQFCWLQGVGAPSAGHAVFKKFMVDAATVRLVKRHSQRAARVAGVVSSSLELVLRSLNNLVERVHHSSFLYVLTSLDRYVSVERYVGSAVVLTAVLQLQAAWSMAAAAELASTATAVTAAVSAVAMSSSVAAQASLSSPPSPLLPPRIWAVAVVRATARTAVLTVATAGLRLLAACGGSTALLPWSVGPLPGVEAARVKGDGTGTQGGPGSSSPAAAVTIATAVVADSAARGAAMAAAVRSLLTQRLSSPEGLLAAAAILFAIAAAAMAAARVGGTLVAGAAAAGGRGGAGRSKAAALGDQRASGSSAQEEEGGKLEGKEEEGEDLGACFERGVWHAERVVVLTTTTAAMTALVCLNWAAAVMAGMYLAPMALWQGWVAERVWASCQQTNRGSKGRGRALRVLWSNRSLTRQMMTSELMQHLAASLSEEPLKKGLPVKDEPRVLLVTTVDVGGGISERIEVRVGEIPEDVARAFCRRYNLPDAIVGPLATHLEDNLRKAAANHAGGDGKTGHDDGRRDSARGADGGRGGPMDARHSARSPSKRLSPAQQDMAGVPNAGDGGTGPANNSSGGGAPAPAAKFSFGSGMDERFYQQLSNKLLDESQAPSARRGNWVSASEVLSGGGGGAAGSGGGSGSGGGGGSGHNSKRSSTGHGNHHPGGPYSYGKNNMAGPTLRDRDSVYLRLYATAQERAVRLEERRRAANAEVVAALTQRRSTMSWISAEMMRGRGANGAYDNYGEMLYAEGVEALMARLKRAEAERKAREAREMDGATFAPAITKKAWELKQRERNSNCAAAAGMSAGGMEAVEEYEKWQRLHMRGVRKSTQERLEQLRQQREAAEVAECTFRPRINKNSDLLMMERSEALKQLNLTHYEQLFADAQRRQMKLEDLRNWYPEGVTFQPQVNKDPRALEYLQRSWDKLKHPHQPQSSNGNAPAGSTAALTSTASTCTGGGAAGVGPGGSQVPPVVARLYAEAERKQAKLEAARQAANGPIDPVTHKPLFQPDCGRGPRGALGHSRSSRRGGHIGEHLYRTAQDLAAKRAAAEEAEQRAAVEAATRSRTTQVSQRIFTDLKLKRFRQIFEYLDENGSGSLDLLAVLGRSPPLEQPDAEPSRHPRADNLDSEVLLDVEAAADVWARANGMMLTSNNNGNKPPRSSATSQQLCGPSGSGCGGMLLSGPCPPMSIEMFMSCMEEALRLRRGPRAYLVPSPPAKQETSHTFRPSINPRSRALAAKSRPETASTFELLHRVAAKTAERLEVLRRRKEEAGMAGCTFQPQLNSNRNSLGGRVSNRSLSASHTVSLDPSAFALAAAGIAAAADESPTSRLRATVAAAADAEAERRDLQQHLQHLRIAADAALDMQVQLMQHQQQGGEGECDGQDVDDDLERFTLLEQELRDMQALTQVAIDDHDRQQQLLRQAAEAAQQQHQHQHHQQQHQHPQQQQLQHHQQIPPQQQQQLQLQQQQQQQQQQQMSNSSLSNCADAPPAGGLQELAAALGVGVVGVSWESVAAQSASVSS